MGVGGECWGRWGCMTAGRREPGTTLVTIALARAAGVRHIIEEGREGGLTAMMYSMHGLRVTSVEYAPLEDVEHGLQALAPDVVRINGDGSRLLPELVANMSDAQAAETAVFFDGAKAY